MNSTKTIILFVLITIFLIIGGAFFFTKDTGSQTAKESLFVNGGKVVVSETQKDWGDIAYEGGNKEATFVIKNEDTQTLRIRNIRTSCHCTKARIVIGENTSPFFGMNSSSSWIGEIPSGGEGKLEVTFDPAYHGVNGLGPITRYVIVETSDPSNGTLEFSLTGVVKK